jgi:outer membrane protein assembly factor BamB
MLAALLQRATAHAQSDVLWRRSIPKTIKYTSLDARGHLLVFTDDGITALDPDSGSQAWRYPAGESIRYFRSTWTGNLLVGSGGTLAALDPATGQVAWRRTDLSDVTKLWIDIDRGEWSAIVQTRNGFAIIDLHTGAALWDSTSLPPKTVVREYFRLPQLNLLVLLARTPTSEVALLGVTVDSGVVRWSEPAMVRGEVKFKRDKGIEYAVVQAPVTLPDSTVVLYFSTEGPIRIDPRSGAVLWRSTALAGKPVPTSRDGYPRSRLLDSLLVVPTEQRLVALDVATGQARWSTAGAFPSRPGWLAVRSSGIATGSFSAESSFVAVLGTDGVRRRATDMPLGEKAMGILLQDTAYVTNAGQLYAIPLETGTERRLASIGFMGDESPIDIDSLEGGGLVLMGRQNLVRINRDGSVVYRRYYPAPKASFLEQLGAIANMTNAPSYAWSTGLLDYYFIFTARADTSGAKGYYLAMLDRRDGKELGLMQFHERNPTFLIDPRSGAVYQIENKDVIARRFPGLPDPKVE